MIDLQFNYKGDENNIYLKWINILINEKIYRRYELDYSQKYTAGELNSIFEYVPDNFQTSILPETVTLPQKAAILNQDTDDSEFTFQDFDETFFRMHSLPKGKIDVITYYSSFDDQENMEMLSVSREEFNSNLWSFHTVDFSGTDNIGMPGQYLYNWLKNRAFLSLNRVIPNLLSTLVVILLRYHKNLYQLITELNMFMVDNSVKYENDKYHHIDSKYNSFI